ncbi:MAG: glycoside hydrolase family 2 TIM barrel-domain containing protein [Thermoguttaceae bacterium]
MLISLLATAACAVSGSAYAQNLALQAKATASESLDDMSPEKAIDGDAGTRWSAKVAHFEGVWYQLQWKKPVLVGQVVIVQYDRFISAADLQTWDEAGGSWKTIQHFGGSNEKLPRVLFATFEPRLIDRLRIANCVGGPSFTEVAVYEKPVPPVVALASDAKGGIIGIVTDQYGSAPINGAKISLAGPGKSGPWHATAKSDDKGLFFAPMPLGLSGQVKATVTVDGRTSQNIVDAAALVYGLSPLGTDTKVVKLDGKQWKFALNPPDGFFRAGFDASAWSDIKVPAHWEMQGFHSIDNVGGYIRRFDVPAGDGRLKLRFDGVYSGAEVWVNGHRLAYHEGGFTPFEIDVTDAVHAGENLLALKVTQHTVASDELDKMSEYTDFDLAGITRSVYLFRTPPTHIAAAQLATVFDEKYQDAAISGKMAVVNESDTPLADVTLSFTLIDSDGKTVAEGTKTLPHELAPWRRIDVDVNLPVKSPSQWNAEHPNLYLLRTELKSGDRVVQTLTQKIGFRQTDVRGTELLINGKPVKIRGTCHHEQHPLLGRAVTPEVERLDLMLMKEANLNALRTSHYPPLPELLDYADELGVYVESEGPFCWVDAADDLRLTPRIMQFNAELLARDRNHPSVFMWSICNESGFGYGFQRSAEWVKAADPTRPRGGSYQESMELDIRHNPISARLIDEADKAGKKPLLWDESFGPYQGAFYDHADLYLDPGIRDYYVEPLIGCYRKFIESKVVQGSQIWAWADDMFCVPNMCRENGRGWVREHFGEELYDVAGRGLCGDAPWGVIDAWRRRKPEFWIVKKLHSPVKLQETPLPLPEAGAPIRIPVQNLYDFTDLSELKIDWQLGDRKGTLPTSLAPRSAGELVIDAGTPTPGDVLAIDFRDANGRIVDKYRLPIGKAAATPAPIAQEASPAPLRIYSRTRLNGETTFISGTNFELGFGHTYGTLRRGVGYGVPILWETPMLHVAKMGDNMHPLPKLREWRLASLDAKSEGRDVRVIVKGSFPHFSGGYDYLISPDGEIVMHSAFTYSGEDFYAHETGIKFTVPRQCELLEWDRQAEFSVYPPDHIGRPHGKAKPVAPHSTNLPPTWAWSADNSLLGTPDFRSTKRHINWATLRYPDSGAGLLFQSNGSQNVRATVDGERIDCFITDWYGGTNAPGEWTESYGSGKLIKNGQLLESKVKFRFLPPSQWAERWGIGSRIDNVRISREPTAPGLRQFGEKTPGAFGTTALTCGVDKLTTETRRTRRTGRNMAERALPRNCSGRSSATPLDA